MKIPIPLAAFLFAAAFAPGEEPQILNVIPDGIPLVNPAPPVPEFKPAPSDVLSAVTHVQDGRTITIKEIKPIDLPERWSSDRPVPPEAEAPAAPQEAVHVEMLDISATIYYFDHSPPRSLVRAWRQEGKQLEFWSSADFSLIAGGIETFTDASGTAYLLAAGAGVAQEEALEIPVFPNGAASYQIIGDVPAAPEMLAALDALHVLYTREHAALLTAHQGREATRLAREAEAAANPPQPKDITLHFWRTETPASEGGAE
ncbi:MAG: hypothetical protein V4733_01100 [Verrucomicrobiota bacterium]